MTSVKRKKAITRQLHDFKGKFGSVSQLKTQIDTKLGDELPNSSKVWLVSAKDLKVMYEKVNSSCEIFLWVQTCEDSDINPEPSRKKGDKLEDKLRIVLQYTTIKIVGANDSVWYP